MTLAHALGLVAIIVRLADASPDSAETETCAASATASASATADAAAGTVLLQKELPSKLKKVVATPAPHLEADDFFSPASILHEVHEHSASRNGMSSGIQLTEQAHLEAEKAPVLPKSSAGGSTQRRNGTSGNSTVSALELEAAAKSDASTALNKSLVTASAMSRSSTGSKAPSTVLTVALNFIVIALIVLVALFVWKGGTVRQVERNPEESLRQGLTVVDQGLAAEERERQAASNQPSGAPRNSRRGVSGGMCC